MINSSIIVKTREDLSGFTIIHKPESNRKIDPKLEQISKEIWQNLLTEYNSKNINVFDGTYYRLDNLDEVRQGSKVLKLSTIKYSTIKSYGVISQDTVLTEDMHTNHISTASLIKTTDNFYVFGQRNIVNKSDFIGGGLLESENIINTGLDIENNQFKEMKEETNIDPTDCQQQNLIGVLLSKYMNVLFIFQTFLSISSTELKIKFKDRIDQEMADLLFVPEKDLESFLKSQDSYRPLVWDLIN